MALIRSMSGRRDQNIVTGKRNGFGELEVAAGSLEEEVIAPNLSVLFLFFMMVRFKYGQRWTASLWGQLTSYRV